MDQKITGKTTTVLSFFNSMFPNKLQKNKQMIMIYY